MKINGNDPMGTAIMDYYKTGKADKLRMLSIMFEEDETPVPYLFRTFPEMPELEQKALGLVRGKVLDVGAGAGCHSLFLQEHGIDVTAIDISPLSCEVMRDRGIIDVKCVDLFDENFIGQYDTALMMMNGIGVAGTLKNLPNLFYRLNKLLAKDGQVIAESCDLRYIYEDAEGYFDPNIIDRYYGEMDYQIQYKDIKGESFYWLYVDYKTLNMVAESCGWKCELILEGDNCNYLTRLTRNI